MSLPIMGDVLEGGGQILRIAVALSAITSRSISVEKIRLSRRKPGLAAQHLGGILLVAQISNGKLSNATLGSTSIEFWPSFVSGGDFVADTKTAGSVALLMQAAMPCCLFGRQTSHLTLKGGTNADMAPPIDFTVNVLKPIFEKFGASFSCKIKCRGFFPAGHGEVFVTVPPVDKLNAVNLTDFGTIEVIDIEAYCAGRIDDKFAKKMAEAAETVLNKRFKATINTRVTAYSRNAAFQSGCGLNILARTTTGCILGACDVGKSSMSPEELGIALSDEISKDLTRQACVDQHLQDQLILPMALACGTSVFRTGPLTLHTETAMHIVGLMCDAKFRVKNDGDCQIIECDGIGFVNVNDNGANS